MRSRNKDFSPEDQEEIAYWSSRLQDLQAQLDTITRYDHNSTRPVTTHIEADQSTQRQPSHIMSNGAVQKRSDISNLINPTTTCICGTHENPISTVVPIVLEETAARDSAALLAEESAHCASKSIIAILN